MNEASEPRKHSDPTPHITDPELMPASLGAIEKIYAKISDILVSVEVENGIKQKSFEVDKSNEAIQALFPDIYRIALLAAQSSSAEQEAADLYLYYPDHVGEYRIDLIYKSELMDIKKQINFADSRDDTNFMNYEDRAQAMLNDIQNSILEENVGMRDVSLQEARDVANLLDLIVPK